MVYLCSRRHVRVVRKGADIPRVGEGVNCSEGRRGERHGLNGAHRQVAAKNEGNREGEESKIRARGWSGHARGLGVMPYPHVLITRVSHYFVRAGLEAGFFSAVHPISMVATPPPRLEHITVGRDVIQCDPELEERERHYERHLARP